MDLLEHPKRTFLNEAGARIPERADGDEQFAIGDFAFGVVLHPPLDLLLKFTGELRVEAHPFAVLLLEFVSHHLLTMSRVRLGCKLEKMLIPRHTALCRELAEAVDELHLRDERRQHFDLVRSDVRVIVGLCGPVQSRIADDNLLHFRRGDCLVGNLHFLRIGVGEFEALGAGVLVQLLNDLERRLECLVVFQRPDQVAVIRF